MFDQLLGAAKQLPQLRALTASLFAIEDFTRIVAAAPQLRELRLSHCSGFASKDCCALNALKEQLEVDFFSSPSMNHRHVLAI